MHRRTYLRFEADYPIPEPGESGAGDVADSLVAGLRAKGFDPSTPEDQEFAHFFRCSSGLLEYEVMVSFDFVDGRTWEISCPPVLGLFSRLLGKREYKELTALVEAIHASMKSDPQVREMNWYRSYGAQKGSSPKPF